MTLPNAFCPVLVAGSSDEAAIRHRRRPRRGATVEVGERRPKVREGYIGDLAPGAEAR